MRVAADRPVRSVFHGFDAGLSQSMSIASRRPIDRSCAPPARGKARWKEKRGLRKIVAAKSTVAMMLSVGYARSERKPSASRVVWAERIGPNVGTDGGPGLNSAPFRGLFWGPPNPLDGRLRSNSGLYRSKFGSERLVWARMGGNWGERGGHSRVWAQRPPRVTHAGDSVHLTTSLKTTTGLT